MKQCNGHGFGKVEVDLMRVLNRSNIDTVDILLVIVCLDGTGNASVLQLSGTKLVSKELLARTHAYLIAEESSPSFSFVESDQKRASIWAVPSSMV